MVLLISGIKVEDVPHDSRTLFHIAPHLKDSASQISSMLPKQITSMGLLYVSQREYAVCSLHDKNISVLGTDDCTTCMAVILRHPLSGAVAVGHLETVVVDGIGSMLNRLQDLSMGYFDQSPVQMHLFGAFSDTRGYSEELIYSVLHFVHKHSIQIDLLTACIGEMNTILRGELPWPITYGVGVNVKTGEIFPATFLDKGPDLPLRHARLLTGVHCLLEVYEYQSGLLRIGPFHYGPLRCAGIWLQESDDFVLQHLSSSPEVELPHVITEIRESLKHIQDHPFPEITVFHDNRPRYYRKDEHGQWVYVRLDSFRFEQMT